MVPPKPRKYNLPDNLYYLSTRGIYRYKHPKTGDFIVIGRDKEAAIEAAEEVNKLYETPSSSSLAEKIVVSTDDNKDAPIVTVSQVIEGYKEKVAPFRPWGEDTRKNYLFLLGKYDSKFGDMDIVDADRKFLGKWLTDNMLSNESYMKHRGLLVDLYSYAVSEKYLNINEAACTLKRSLSKKLDSNKKTRQRLSVECFWAIHAEAGEEGLSWLKNAMELSLVTLQARKEICTMLYTDCREGQLFVIRDKTSAESDMAFIKIAITGQIEEIIGRTRRDDIASPLIIHYSPSSRRRAHIDAKPNWSAVMPDYLTRKFATMRDKVPQIAAMPVEQRPGFHEIKSLGGRLYRELGYSEGYIQSLMTHTSKKTTRIYLEGGELTDANYIQVKAGLKLKGLPTI